MAERICIVGLDEPEVEQIRERLAPNVGLIAHEVVPRIVVNDGQLLVEGRRSPGMIAVDKVVFHAIYDNDLDFFCGLALWNGPCLPDARAMMDCRLKFPCLIRALQYTRFGSPARGYAGPHAPFVSERERVAKWGNWHCGENKARFTGTWTSENACIVEDFLPGDAVRVVVIGNRHWQIKLEGDDWLKSIHAPNAAFMETDAELLEDTRAIGKAFGLAIVANDYIVTPQGTKHLLEVNHIPNVTRFPEIWEAYRDYVINWLNGAR